MIRLKISISAPQKLPTEYERTFEAPEVVIGSAEGCDIILPLEGVLPRQLLISRSAKGYFVESLGGGEDLFLNGVHLKAGVLPLELGALLEAFEAKILITEISWKEMEHPVEEKTSVIARKMVQDALAQDGEDRPYLIYENGPRAGHKVIISPDVSEVTFGRASDCDEQLQDANISRRHAMVHFGQGGCLIRDLGSKNGVLVNGKKIQGEVLLANSDTVTIGPFSLSFMNPAASLLEELGGISAFQSEPVQGTDLNDNNSEDLEAAKPLEKMPTKTGRIASSGSLAAKMGSGLGNTDFILLSVSGVALVALIILAIFLL